MRSRSLLVLALAVSCLAQADVSGVIDKANTPESGVRTSFDLNPSTFSIDNTTAPPTSAWLRNRIPYFVSDLSIAKTFSFRVRGTEQPVGYQAIFDENSQNSSFELLLENVQRSEAGQLTTREPETLPENVIEPRAVTLPIKITDVTGLSAALSQINNSLAALNTTLSNLTTTVNNSGTTVANLSVTVNNLNTTVNNLAATVTNLSAGLGALRTTVQNLPSVPNFADFETPSGVIDGSNSVFALNASPSPASSLTLIKNGQTLTAGHDYSLSGNNILFLAGAVPQPGDALVASYRY